MEYCFTTTFDLLETTKLVSPWLLVFIVYFIWHHQKKKEVLANFAHELIIKDINVHTSIYKNKDIDSQMICELLKDYQNNIKLFSYLIKNKNDISILDIECKRYSDLYKNFKESEYNLSNLKLEYQGSKVSGLTKYKNLLVKYINFSFF